MDKQYSLAEIQRIHKKYAPSDGTYDLIFTHCQIVHDIAIQLIKTNMLAVNIELVKAGSLLHDIGAYPLIDHTGTLHKGTNYVKHGVIGESILQDEGAPIELQRIASHHTGVGLTKEDVERFEIPIPVKDYVAETDEEQLIMYADKFHSKTTPPYFNSYEYYLHDVAKFGKNKADTFEQMALRFGKPDLLSLQKKFGFDIR